MASTRLLADLDPDQRRAVTETTHPLCIIAGAGSGKTRVLTRRIAYRIDTEGLDPRHILALTFTRKAATEIRTRLGRFGMRDRPHAGTFHAIAWAQVRMWHRDAMKPAPALAPSKARLLADLPARGDVPVADLAAEIEWARARDIAPEDYARAAQHEDRRLRGAYEQVGVAMAEYAERKRRRGVMDFDDMLALCADLLERDPAFAAAQRWRFRHLFVDEFQDVNPLQHRLLRGWLGDRTDLCVVGDPNQAIYRWNGATADYLTSFAVHHPGAAIVDLRRNYRSTPQILHVATAVLGGDGRFGFQPHRPPGEVPTFRRYRDDADEARGIALEAQLLHRPGTRWDRQAVLVRTNAQMAPLETAFARARIPFRTRAGESLTARPDVRAALRHVSKGEDTPIGMVIGDLVLMSGDATTVDDGTDRARMLDSLVRLAQELETMDPTATERDLWGWLRAAGGEGAPGVEGDAVEIVTFHAAKGLEWPIVHVAGLEDGLVPISRAKTPEAEAEERRLLHVAMTRATEQMRLSMAFERTFRGEVAGRRESPYSPAIDAALAQLRADEQADPGEGLARSRQALSSAPGASADRDLLDALHAWRAAVARRAGIAPAVVASDRVLSDVAHRRPTDREALGAILGIGPMVLDAHGDDLLGVVSSHVTPAGAP